MKRIDVVKKNGEWRGESNGRVVAGTKASRKEDAVKAVVGKVKSSREPVTVKIHTQDGRFQEERTYPRSADPRRSKG